MKTHKRHLLTLIALLSAATLPAANISWTNSAGGNFEDSANWNANVPGASDRAFFNTPGTYTVNAGANRSIEGITLTQTAAQGDITINLGGHTLNATSTAGTSSTTASLFIEGASGFTQRMRFTNGTFTTAGTVRIGQAANNTAEVVVGSGATYRMDGEARVGNSGNGIITVENGGKLQVATTFDVASGAGSSGTVVVSGTGSRLEALTAGRLFAVGNSGIGRLTLADGAVAQINTTLDLGRNASGHGILEMSQNASLLLTNRTLNVGLNGTAKASLQSGASISAARLDIGAGGILEVSDASITVSGSTASVWNEGGVYRTFLQSNPALVQFDRLEINYTTLDIQLLEGENFVPQMGGYYSLIGYTQSFSGQFRDSEGNILSEGDEIKIGEHSFKLSYGKGSNGQIGLTHIPEPAHIVSGGAAAILVLVLALRRRR